MKLGINADVYNKNFACIYVIYSPSFKIYIGQTDCFRRRLTSYRNFKKIKKQGQRKLYNSFNKYGEQNHFIDVVKICSKEELDELERRYIKCLNTFNTDHGMNLTSGGDGGYERSDETKQLLREKKLGKKNTDEQNRKIKETSKKTWGEIVQTKEYWENKKPSPLKGVKKSPEHAAKCRVANLGNKLTDEQKKIQSELQKGRKHTDEAKEKISASRKGKKRAPFTEEAKRNMSNGQKGKKQSAEAIAKSAKSRTGLKHSEYTKNKIGKRSKERWQNPAYRAMMIERRNDQIIQAKDKATLEANKLRKELESMQKAAQ